MIKYNLLVRVFRLLNKKDRIKFLILTSLQTSLSILDALGVFLIGILGSLGFNGAVSRAPGTRVNSLLEILHINNFSLQTQCTILGSAAAIVLISKTILSVFVSRKILFFLSIRAAQTTQHLTKQLLEKPLIDIQSKSMQENIYIVTSGVSNIIQGILGAIAMLISDTILLVILLVTLFIAEPSTALITLILFGGVLYVLYSVLQKKAKLLGVKQAKLSIKSSELLREVLSSYRQSVVSGRRGYYSNEVGVKQMELAKINAEVSFFPNISKYSLEIVVVISTLLIAALQFIQSDADHAVAVLSIFLASSTRIAPAILRLQQNLISIKTLSGSALESLTFAETLSRYKNNTKLSPFNIVHDGFIPKVEVQNIRMIYPGGDKLILNDVNFSLKEFSISALVGKSGAGKTTLVDIILGIHNPISGKVTISKVPPSEATNKWPGAVAYVPQDIKIINGTIKENIIVGYANNEIKEVHVREAIEKARLTEFVATLPNGLETYIGDGGSFLSGGQKQRLGIARALLTRPKLLILDEATNAMDERTESEFFQILHKLKEDMTVIIIAHNVTAARNAETILSIVDGELKMNTNKEYFANYNV
jgi:ABC-type bacteriocin/lantibiotic exporter with double-glycine peptidase domain